VGTAVPGEWSGDAIRRRFLEFYAARGHKILPSSSLVPDDPTVFLTIAGMLQFKPIFLGKVCLMTCVMLILMHLEYICGMDAYLRNRQLWFMNICFCNFNDLNVVGRMGNVSQDGQMDEHKHIFTHNMDILFTGFWTRGVFGICGTHKIIAIQESSCTPS